jgi:hypothetical protein
VNGNQPTQLRGSRGLVVAHGVSSTNAS